MTTGKAYYNLNRFIPSSGANGSIAWLRCQQRERALCGFLFFRRGALLQPDKVRLVRDIGGVDGEIVDMRPAVYGGLLHRRSQPLVNFRVAVREGNSARAIVIAGRQINP